MTGKILPPEIPQPAREAGVFIAKYAAVVVKNVVGYVLILSALVVSGVVPVPIGTPLFLIGFALITFPGKRRLTSSALRGIPIQIHGRKAMTWRLIVSMLMPPCVLIFLHFQRKSVLHPSEIPMAHLFAIYAGSIIAAWIVTLVLLLVINAFVRLLPRIRRRVRPWMREHGIHLLPPRKRKRLLGKSRAAGDGEGILKIDLPHNPFGGRGEKQVMDKLNTTGQN